MKHILVVSVVLILCACSGGDQEGTGQAWQEQIDTLEKAKEVEDLLGQASKRQQHNINEQTQ